MRKVWIGLAIGLIVVGTLAAVAFGIAQRSEKPKLQLSIQREDVLAAPLFDKRVSVEFKDATISEVLNWFSTTGVNFVAPTMVKDQRVTLKVQDVPLRDVLRALSDVFGLTWSKQGEVYTLKPRAGQLFQFDNPRDLPERRFFFNDRDLEEWLKNLPRFNDPRLDADVRERLEELFRRFRDLPFEPAPKKEKGFANAFSFDVGNVEKLLDSLTDEQWKKQESQGYLSLNDLTAEQRELLGNPPSPFEMSVEVRGKRLVIKG